MVRPLHRRLIVMETNKLCTVPAFAPFFPTKAAGDGVRLGLAAVYEMVGTDARFTAESGLGSGAMLTVGLPPAGETGERVQDRPRPTRLIQGSGTVLLAEDEPRLRNLVCEALQRQGYTVLVARDGAEAMRLSEQYLGPIHILLSDVVMPGMSGRQLADRLAPVRPEIRVVYMSGHDEATILRYGVSRPGTVFLQKPFTLETLARKLREAVDAARADVTDHWS